MTNLETIWRWCLVNVLRWRHCRCRCRWRHDPISEIADSHSTAGSRCTGFVTFNATIKFSKIYQPTPKLNFGQCCQKGWHKRSQSFDKSSQKRAPLKNQYKTGFQQVLRIKILDFLIELIPKLFRTSFKQFLKKFLVHFKKVAQTA